MVINVETCCYHVCVDGGYLLSVIWDREYRDQRLKADTIAHVA
jgi:hypothetical protein